MKTGLRGTGAVYLREMLILKHRFFHYLASMMVLPFLYLVAFGTAMGGSAPLAGHSYLEFLLPGLIAMTCMTQSYGIATEINIARFYLHVFEEFQAAPISNAAHVLGEVLSGMTRAALGVAVILLMGLAFSVRLHIGPYFLLAAALNAWVFCLARRPAGDARQIARGSVDGIVFHHHADVFSWRHPVSARTPARVGANPAFSVAADARITCDSRRCAWPAARADGFHDSCQRWRAALFPSLALGRPGTRLRRQ